LVLLINIVPGKNELKKEMPGKWKLERNADKAAQFIVEVCVHSTYVPVVYICK
jgi:hypothetical protein